MGQKEMKYPSVHSPKIWHGPSSFLAGKAAMPYKDAHWLLRPTSCMDFELYSKQEGLPAKISFFSVKNLRAEGL